MRIYAHSAHAFVTALCGDAKRSVPSVLSAAYTSPLADVQVFESADIPPGIFAVDADGSMEFGEYEAGALKRAGMDRGNEAPGSETT